MTALILSQSTVMNGKRNMAYFSDHILTLFFGQIGWSIFSPDGLGYLDTPLNLKLVDAKQDRNNRRDDNGSEEAEMPSQIASALFKTLLSNV
jgi:hypothetical protein